MAFVKVIVKDKYTLELVEDAKKGDIIDLQAVATYDSSNILQAIENGTDLAYKTMLEKELENKEREIKSEYLNELNIQKSKIEESYKTQLERLLQNKDKDLEDLRREKDNEIIKLNNSISELKAIEKSLQSNRETELSIKELQVERKFSSNIAELKSQIESITNRSNFEKTNLLTKHELDLKQLEAKLNDEFNKKEETYRDKLNEAEKQIEDLKRSRSSMNIKNIGENLENWCVNEFNQYKIAGFEKAEFVKDNQSVKLEGESKGSKGDFIFTIYDDQGKVLTKAMLDMKSEDPNSVNKKTNEFYLKQLDNNRKKKDCQYAILVSELEEKASNDVPIRKVGDYKDMYIVRPAYMISFLSMIYSLSRKFSALLNKDYSYETEMKESREIIGEFESFKKTYLDDPLKRIKNEVDNILKQNSDIKSACDSIVKANQKIDDSINNLINKLIEQAKEKIERFDIKKIGRKLEKLNG